jgi:cobalt-zinc-cadmium efflux system protein
MSHVKKPLAIAAGINTVIFIGEIFGGIKGHSNSLIMDGVHNFSDELALVCLYLAYLIPVKMSRNIQRIANVLNSIGIMTICGLLIWQSVEHTLNPGVTIGSIPIVAGILAAVANWCVAKILSTVKGQNSAIRLAYIHNLGDVNVSLAPAVAGIIVIITGKSYFDPLIAIIIGIWLIGSTGKEIVKSYNELIWPENAVCKHENELAVHNG